jgi:hypothetical protein
MPSLRVDGVRMGPADEPSESDPVPFERLREIVPARAVLTELARGFLLEHQTNPARAVRFAETFLKECTSEARPERSDPARTPPRPAPRAFRGAIDPTNFPPVR